jgi:hypothetical protein
MTVRQVQLVECEQNAIKASIFKLNFFLTACTIAIIFTFNRVLLYNMAAVLLSGCVWFPQILSNAANGLRNSPKFKHVVIT